MQNKVRSKNLKKEKHAQLHPKNSVKQQKVNCDIVRELTLAFSFSKSQLTLAETIQPSAK